jgi:hypothetical protein
MSQGGTPTQSSVTSSEPWKPVQTPIANAATRAQWWMENPESAKIYEGTTVIPHSNQTSWGLNNTQAFAQGAGQNMQNQAGGIIGSGGFNTQQRGALNTMQGGLGGTNANMNTGINAMQAGLGGTNAASNAALGSLGQFNAGNGGNAGMNGAFNSLSQLNAGNGTNANMNAALGSFGQFNAGNGTNANMNTATGVLGSGASGRMNVNAGQFNEVYNDLNGNPASAQNLSRMASGALLGGGNPYLKGALRTANENAMTGVGDAMSAAGRYGSGTHQASLAKAINESNTDAMFGQYNQDVANMMGANNQIDNARLGYAGQQLNAASGAAGVNAGNVDRRLNSATGLFNAGNTAYANDVNAASNLFGAGNTAYANDANAASNMFSAGNTMYGNDANAASNYFNAGNSVFGNQQNAAGNVFNAGNSVFNNQQNAAGNVFNAGQSGLGNMSSAYQAGLQPGQTMAGVGGAYEGLAAARAKEQMDKFYARKDAPLDVAARTMAIASGAGQLGSTSKQQVYQPTQWGQVGANAAGAALAGK